VNGPQVPQLQVGQLRFTLYSRSWCHLCEDMLAALQAFMAREGRPYSVDVVDVDADPGLVARFDELVPVLYGDPAGLELCHYFLDEAALRRHLAQATDAGAPA
jgi:hypothetical protein